MTSLRRMDVRLAEVALAAEGQDGGEPVIVFLHAGVCDRRSYRSTIELLDAPGTKLAYDRRGFGDSPPSAGGFTHLDDLRALVEAVADAPVWLVGSSMGGGVALDLALTSNGLVAGLVLFAPAISGAPRDEELDPVTLAHVRNLDAAYARGDMEEVNRLEVRVWLDGPGEAEGRVDGPARELARAMNAVILANGGEDVGGSGLDTWARLEEITAPTTVACGTFDLPLLLERSEVLAERLPNADLVRLEGRAHLPYLEDPTTSAELIRRAMTAPTRPPAIG